MLHIYIDADACPVKDEVYRVAQRLDLAVTVVANAWMRVPNDPRIQFELVSDGFDAADDWIADHVELGDIIITTDIPLADRCLKQGGEVLTPTGKRYTRENIGSAVASRELLAELRNAGEIAGGPPPMQDRDRSRFLQELDALIRLIERNAQSE